MTIHPEILSDVFAVYKFLIKQGWQGIPFHTPAQFSAMTLYGNRMAATPMPMQPLWRGENEYHEKCMPSLYRRTWSSLEALERQVQLEDFRLILKNNPQVQEMEKGGLEVNYIGMAQHYGIETHVLDLTNSFLVSAFFATTTYDSLKDAYFPILHTISQGVIYFFSLGCMFNFGQAPAIWPIGLEALHRPGEQRGFGIEMTDQNHDLNNYSGAYMFRFWHNPEASMRIWQITKGGSTLFPYDPMAEKVRNIRNYRIYSEEALRLAYENSKGWNVSLDEVRKSLLSAGCTFVNKIPFAYTINELKYINDQYRKMYPDSFENDDRRN